MSNQQAYEAAEVEYGTREFPHLRAIPRYRRQAPTMGRRRGKAPQSFNGMHRRRRRKINW